jgi:hypothetical protein
MVLSYRVRFRSAGLRGLLVNRYAGDWQQPERRAGSSRGVAVALYAGLVGLFLCGLATLFGLGADGGWLALPPDYTAMGWTMRLLGGVTGGVLIVYLCLTQRAYLSRRRSRSYTGKMARIGLAVCVASIAWEFALLGLVPAIILGIGYALFSKGGW